MQAAAPITPYAERWRRSQLGMASTRPEDQKRKALRQKVSDQIATALCQISALHGHNPGLSSANAAHGGSLVARGQVRDDDQQAVISELKPRCPP